MRLVPENHYEYYTFPNWKEDKKKMKKILKSCALKKTIFCETPDEEVCFVTTVGSREAALLLRFFMDQFDVSYRTMYELDLENF